MRWPRWRRLKASRGVPSYILRNIDPKLWAKFKARAAETGIPMRALMLILVEAFVDGRLAVAARKPKR